MENLSNYLPALLSPDTAESGDHVALFEVGSLNEAEALDIVRSALWTVILASGPPVLAAMLVGIVIAFFQALTQIQEMTLTFIPKMITVFGMLVATGPFIGEQMLIFSQQAVSRMETGFDRARFEPNARNGSSPVVPFDLRPGFRDFSRPVDVP